MSLFGTADIAAIAFFVLAWAVYAITLERTAHGRNSLNARMSIYREVWVRRILDREARMVDMQIMASLQNGTAFFASTTLLAIGGGLTLLRSTEEAMSVLSTLPLGIRSSPALWEIKCVGLIVIFVYAFFKFSWAYRLFNYVAILLGAMPFADKRDTPRSAIACDANHKAVSVGGPALQPRPARLPVCAGLSRLVHQSVGVDRHHVGHCGCDMAPAIRFRRLSRDDEISRSSLPRGRRCVMAWA